MTLNPIGRAHTEAEIQQSRYLDALIAFRPESCLRMEDDKGDGDKGDGGGGSGDTGSGQGGSDDGDKGKQGGSDKGYPANTPVAEMSTDQQAAYWKAQAQKHEGRNRELTSITGGKYGNDLKADLDELERLRTERMSDNEKAVEEAKKQGREEAQREIAPRMVRVAFESALGHIGDDQRAELLDGIALDKFLTSEGYVDTAKVQKHVALIAPAKGTDGKTPDNFGQGPRGGGGGKTASVASGADLYASRRGKSTTTS